MTESQSSRIVRKEAQAFARAAASDATELPDLIILFERSGIAAADAVLLLADLEIHRRRFMRRVRACAVRLKKEPVVSPATLAEATTRRAA